MWFSSGGTKSVLHNDDVDNINCLFSGTKELLFIDYKKYKEKVLFRANHLINSWMESQQCFKILKLINNSSSQNKANHYREGRLEMWS